MTDKTDKELIAELDGWKLIGEPEFIHPYKVLRKGGTEYPWINSSGESIPHFQREIKYDTSWDWLMPVVEKIHNVIREDSSYLLETCGKVNENEEDINKWREWQRRKITLTTSIEGVYRDVVEFIKFYNSTKADRK